MASVPRPTVDVTSLEQAVELLQQRLDLLQGTLQQQQKLATLGMVTAVIAHEFNNILTPMISYTRYALSPKADEGLRTKALEKALVAGERAANVSNSLLGFARGDESKAAEVKAALTETLSCLARDLGKDGITLTTELEEGLWVAMNRGQFQQVLMNLVVNARAAMLEGRGGAKRLTVTAARIKKGKIAEISVQDTGKGIAAEVLPRIFEPFFSTKAKGPESGEDEGTPRGGTGLGLTICHELIAGAGGTIRVESEVGKGTRFVIELPVGEGAES